jgi:hypothetical protein
MRKRVFIAAIAVTVILVLALAGTAFAGSTLSGRGPVKTDLVYYVYTPDPDNPTKVVVGSVSFNTTGRGYLNVLVSIENLPNLNNYDVRVCFTNYDAESTYSDVYSDVLDTRLNGKGRVQLRVPIPAIEWNEGKFGAKVVIDEELSAAPYPAPLGGKYVTDYIGWFSVK